VLVSEWELVSESEAALGLEQVSVAESEQVPVQPWVQELGMEPRRLRGTRRLEHRHFRVQH
jgi:hypothetical protein